MSRLKNVLVGGRQAKALYYGTRLVWRARPPALKGVTVSTVIRGQMQIRVRPNDPAQLREWLALAAGATLKIGDEAIPIERAHIASWGAVNVVLKGKIDALYDAFTPVEAQP
ncbi:hypothetical protein [Trueperella pyogenes]|uniref:hypothetical protein n=1 Tax=Trueperella pyogenes TaxID=1661 RepID=UPI00312BBF66